MLPDFFQLTHKGIYCPYGKFYLDAKVAVDHCIISHAHADHAVKNHQNIYTTEATEAFMKYRYKTFAGKQFHVFHLHQSFILNGVKVTFFSAGHILGSVQVLMEFDGVRYLYSGDFKTVSDTSCADFEVVETDVLLTESTFANPDFLHPDPVKEIQKLNELNGNIMLGAYALGKAQRLTQLIHQYCPQKQILLHHAIYPIHKIYNRLGIDLGYYHLYNRKLMKSTSENQVYIVPPLTFGSYLRSHHVHRVFATGWQHRHQGNDKALYISDHADWGELIQYVKASKARLVLTTHGEGKYLAGYFENQIIVRELV